jgi:hypothetical protein
MLESCIKFYSNIRKGAKKTLAMNRQAFREESMAAHGQSKLTLTEKARQAKSKVESMLMTFTSRGCS